MIPLMLWICWLHYLSHSRLSNSKLQLSNPNVKICWQSSNGSVVWLMRSGLIFNIMPISNLSLDVSMLRALVGLSDPMTSWICWWTSTHALISWISTYVSLSFILKFHSGLVRARLWFTWCWNTMSWHYVAKLPRFYSLQDSLHIFTRTISQHCPGCIFYSHERSHWWGHQGAAVEGS